jgi:putative tricarboxylic transport membrane protein
MEILQALLLMLQWEPVIAMVIGTILGIALGAMPGRSATLGIAHAIPFT